MEDVIKQVGWALAASGGFLLAAAGIVYSTGEDVARGVGTWHTHADASLVLLVLGLLALGNGLGAFVWAKQLAGARRRRGTGLDWQSGS